MKDDEDEVKIRRKDCPNDDDEDDEGHQHKKSGRWKRRVFKIDDGHFRRTQEAALEKK